MSRLQAFHSFPSLSPLCYGPSRTRPDWCGLCKLKMADAAAELLQGLVELFPALPLTFPCRCWDSWPLQPAVPRCLWVLLIATEWSSQHVEMHSACVRVRSRPFQVHDLLCVPTCCRAMRGLCMGKLDLTRTQWRLPVSRQLLPYRQ